MASGLPFQQANRTPVRAAYDRVRASVNRSVGRRFLLVPGAAALAATLAVAAWGGPLEAKAATQCADRFRSPELLPIADGILEGVVDVGIFEPVELGADLTWSEDPFEDANWRHRLHFLRWLEALREAFRETGDARYLDRWRTVWLDWRDDNPVDAPAAGAAWAHHPTGLRAKILACALEEHPDETWISPLLRQHALLLARSDFYVGHGNHALNQIQGLLAAGCVLGEPNWVRLALDRLEPLATESIDADGATNEGSISYAIYNFERYVEAAARITGCGQEVPTVLSERLPKLARFIAHATLPNGEIPLIGDANVKRPFAWYGTNVEYALSAGERGTPAQATAITYDRGGWAFGRTSWDPEELRDGVVYTLRTGHASRIHAHDDLGHLSVFAHGRRLLEDSGLHRYTSPMNRYFYRAAAHNGVVVDDARYRRKLGSQLVAEDRTEGYDRYVLNLPVWRGVRWQRHVLFARDAGWFIVDDRLRATRSRTFHQLWHLAPEADPILEGTDGMRTRFERGNVAIGFVGTSPELHLTEGDSGEPPAYFARTYGDLIPTSMLRATARGQRARFVTVLSTSEASEPLRLDAASVTEDGIRARVVHEGRTDLVRWHRDDVTITCLRGC